MAAFTCELTILMFYCTLCLAMAVAGVASGTCQGKVFVPVSDSHHPGRLIQRSGPATVYQCERMCRMYSECYGFNMQWSDNTQTTGFCEALDVSDREAYGVPGYLPNYSYTYYGELNFGFL